MAVIRIDRPVIVVGGSLRLCELIRQTSAEIVSGNFYIAKCLVITSRMTPKSSVKPIPRKKSKVPSYGLAK